MPSVCSYGGGGGWGGCKTFLTLSYPMNHFPTSIIWDVESQKIVIPEGKGGGVPEQQCASPFHAQ